MELWILFGSFFLLIAFNVPIAFALGIAAAATMLYDGLPLMVEVQRIASGHRACSRCSRSRSSSTPAS